MSRLVVVGDALLDRDLVGHAERLTPDAPAPVVDDPASRSRPGGAGLAAALLAADGHDVLLVTAMAPDAAGRELRSILESCSVEVVDLGGRGRTPEKVRVTAQGRSIVRLDYGGREPLDLDGAPAGRLARVASADAVLVSDYGRGITAHAPIRETLARVPPRIPTVWDPHPRGHEPLPGTWMVTPNESEAATFAGGAVGGVASVTAHARRLVAAWDVRAVAVTRGASGAIYVAGEDLPLAIPGRPVAAGDTCGAGDRFASAAVAALANGAIGSEAVEAAVDAAAAFVGAGAAGAFEPGRRTPVPGEPADPVDLARRWRDRGGTVVTAGGCFDLLHAGHVSLLQRARALGDCLIVCMNSDRSVRRLKGPGRPVVPQEDRARVLLALGCVDAVAVFDEDTPERLLERLRPHVFAKGGDYTSADIPERACLARWGGTAVVVPYIEGRSTTRILQEVNRDGT